MIGWYVHHHGRGHASRATAVARRLDSRVVGLGTGARPDGWPGAWVPLPPDDTDPCTGDPTASGRLHWTPPTAGVRQRATMLSAALDHHRLRLVVVDVSVEATLLAKLHGARVVVVGQPGRRTDPAHALAHDVAELLVLPWPSWVGEEPWTTRTATPTLHVGAIGAHARVADGAPTAAPTRRADDPRRRLAVLLGAGGHEVADLLVDLATHRPDWTIDVLGRVEVPRTSPGNLHLHGWVDDPPRHLRRADAVLCHAGQNAVADVAAARTPAVVLPQDRPFGEQHALAAVLQRHGLARVAPPDAGADRVARLVGDAMDDDGDRWATWDDGAGADRFAAVLDDLHAALEPA